ncbi:metal ABC transporter permease [Thermaurantimonas aggregans]|uniref:metal ABC transporter permease n=1 Tax=Thermaurantimonas aggregans TaxID=2173829 RepID=UPI0023F419DB|nr:metal ABC transporter permease [Thermaurantimonas aggregans]MCX8149786.1 metal ABC transporter permease [Thermaurantimonas aggregans]
MMDIEILLTALFLSSAAALAGSFLVLSGRSMFGDALSHAVLPGIVLMYLLTGERSFGGSLVGAILTAIVVSYLIEHLQHIRGIPSDAAIGAVFVVFFASGIILISGPAAGVDLDQECVLFGEIAFVPFERLKVGDIDLGAKSIWISAGLLVFVSVFIYLFKSVYSIVTFNGEFADSIGIRSKRWQLLYSILISVVVVIGFELVGAILIISLLVAPSAIAWLFSTRLNGMLRVAVLVAVVSSLIGTGAADVLDVSISGSIASVQGILFFMASAVFYSRFTKKLKKVH